MANQNQGNQGNRGSQDGKGKDSPQNQQQQQNTDRKGQVPDDQRKQMGGGTPGDDEDLGQKKR